MVLIIVVSILAFAELMAALFAAIGLILRRKSQRRMAQVTEGLSGEGVIDSYRMANFFGFLSKSSAQVRGNGVLVLTGRALSFSMFVPKRLIRVPLEKITRLDNPR